MARFDDYSPDQQYKLKQLGINSDLGIIQASQDPEKAAMIRQITGSEQTPASRLGDVATGALSRIRGVLGGGSKQQAPAPQEEESEDTNPSDTGVSPYRQESNLQRSMELDPRIEAMRQIQAGSKSGGVPLETMPKPDETSDEEAERMNRIADVLAAQRKARQSGM